MSEPHSNSHHSEDLIKSDAKTRQFKPRALMKPTKMIKANCVKSLKRSRSSSSSSNDSYIPTKHHRMSSHRVMSRSKSKKESPYRSAYRSSRERKIKRSRRSRTRSDVSTSSDTSSISTNSSRYSSSSRKYSSSRVHSRSSSSRTRSYSRSRSRSSHNYRYRSYTRSSSRSSRNLYRSYSSSRSRSSSSSRYSSRSERHNSEERENRLLEARINMIPDSPDPRFASVLRKKSSVKASSNGDLDVSAVPNLDDIPLPKCTHEDACGKKSADITVVANDNETKLLPREDLPETSRSVKKEFNPPSQDDLAKYQGMIRRADIHAKCKQGLISPETAQVMLENEMDIEKEEIKESIRAQMEKVGLGALVDQFTGETPAQSCATTNVQSLSSPVYILQPPVAMHRLLHMAPAGHNVLQYSPAVQLVSPYPVFTSLPHVLRSPTTQYLIPSINPISQQQIFLTSNPVSPIRIIFPR